MEMINVTVWNEYIHERSGRVAEIYPGGIHGAIAEMLGRDKKYNIRTATLDMPENGLSTVCQKKSSTTPMSSSGGVTARTTKYPTRSP